MLQTANATLPELDHLIRDRVDEIVAARVDEILAQRDAERRAKPKKMAIIATKGTLDWAYPPLILATTGASLGWDVGIFYTFYGLKILQKNRKLETNSFVLKDAHGNPIALAGPHIAVGDLIAHIPANAYRAVTVGATTYWCFTLVVQIATLGRVRLVISFANADLTGTYAVLVTNQREWSAQKIIATYLQRWPIETFYQDGKGHLGLDAYRMRSAEAIGKHWCLVFVAYSFLHLACLAPSPAKGSIPVKTIGEACRQQAQVLIEKLLLYVHERLMQGQPADEVFAHLFAKQRVLLSS